MAYTFTFNRLFIEFSGPSIYGEVPRVGHFFWFITAPWSKEPADMPSSFDPWYTLKEHFGEELALKKLKRAHQKALKRRDKVWVNLDDLDYAARHLEKCLRRSEERARQEDMELKA